MTVTEEENGDITLALTDDFEGGGTYIGGEQFSILDLSALTRDTRVTVLAGDIISVEPIDGSLPATTFEQFDRVILGDGDDVFDGTGGSGFVEAVAGNGDDRLLSSSNGAQNVLSGAGFMSTDGGADIIDGTGATTVIGGSGNDVLSGGLGDTLAGGPGADSFVIYGVGAEGAGPALITDFNPVQFDRLVYTPVNLNGSNPSPEVVIQQDTFSTSIIENGQVMVVLQGISSFDNPNITITEPVTRLPV
jgi:Ca2+-binding RTX toxin-like protein